MKLTRMRHKENLEGGDAEASLAGRQMAMRARSNSHLHSVNVPPFGKITTWNVSSILSTRVLPVSQAEITGRDHRFHSSLRLPPDSSLIRELASDGSYLDCNTASRQTPPDS
jgi:hypothetical protein